MRITIEHRTIRRTLALGWAFAALGVALGGFGCRTTKPGTHVEGVEKGGQKVYVAGAAGPGMNESLACRGAVQRAVAAIALDFAQDFDDVGDEVAEAMGASNGQVFLEGYAKQQALNAPVQDTKFNPIEHLCMATVRWTPPVFVKDAVMKFAESWKAQEMAAAQGTDSTSSPSAASSTAPAPSAAAPVYAAPAPVAAAPSAAPPAPVSVAPPPAAPKAAAPTCAAPKKALAKVLAKNQKALNDFNECMRRTKDDETICHRYKLYLDQAQKEEGAAGQALSDCLNGGLSTKIRMSLTKNLPGHAGVSVETREDGTLIIWTFSPVDQTAFAYEMAEDGSMHNRTPLASNQVQWVKEQLGL